MTHEDRAWKLYCEETRDSPAAVDFPMQVPKDYWKDLMERTQIHAWLLEHKASGERELEFYRPHSPPLTSADKEAGWTAIPLGVINAQG